MDGRSLEKVIRKREKGYIWLEHELKICIGITASVMLALFIVLTAIWKFQWLTVENGAVLFLLGTIIIEITIYQRYRNIYHNFDYISRYLVAYENGDYQFHTEEFYMQEGLQSQIIDQLERMGMAMEVMKSRMVDEKENTKALITDISHQLKTPLSALRLTYDLVQEGQMTAEEQNEIMARGGAELAKLQSLMDSLTNLSRMEAGMIQIDPISGDIVETLTKAVSSVYMKAYQKHIEIEMEDTEHLLKNDREIRHDPKWTEEAFVNLLDNAIKYSLEYTTVRIRIEPKISYILIHVIDEGIGIPKEEYGNIFKRFYRVHKKDAVQEEGSGVGLYLVRRIIEGQGGNIRVKSEYGAGSIFQVMLPKKCYDVGVKRDLKGDTL